MQRCIDEGLVGGEGFVVDASLIQADANKQRSVPGSEWDPNDIPPDAKQAVQDYLATLDDAAFGAASEVTPKFVSPSDPAAQWSGALRGPAFFAYAINYLIDTDNAVIVDVEATRAIRQAEVGAARTMIGRVMNRFGLYLERLAGDSAYGVAEMVGWLVKEQSIEPHVAIVDKGEREDGTFSRSDFIYDLEKDVYICRVGKILKLRRRQVTTKPVHVDKNGMMKYRTHKANCSVCPLKSRCCPKGPMRIVHRSVHEGARDMARAIADTDAGQASRRDRKKVEMLFAHLKRILRLGRLRLRGPCGASDEFLLVATAQTSENSPSSGRKSDQQQPWRNRKEGVIDDG